MTKPPAVAFREAASSDATAVSHLIGSTWAKFFAYSVTEADLETYLTKTVSPEQIKREIEDANRLFLIAESTAGLIGVAQLNLDTTETGLRTTNPVELNRLYIDPEQQGSGLAAQLLRYTEEKGRNLGKAGLWLGVWEDNARGIRFYEKMGFERVGEHSFWVGQSKRRDWIMEKGLE